MSDRKPTPFPVLLNNEVCSLVQADENVYQIRFKNRAANVYLVRGSARTILIDVGLSTNYPYLVECLNHLGCPPETIDMVVLSHEHLDHIGAAYHFNRSRAYVAAHRLAANKIMLRDDFSMLRKMFNEPNKPIDVDIWLEEGSTGRELFVVLDGKIDIVKIAGATKTTIVTLGKGEFFGEMAVMSDQSRNATVRAKEAVDVLLIPKDDFARLGKNLPAFAEVFRELAAKRSTKSDS